MNIPITQLLDLHKQIIDAGIMISGVDINGIVTPEDLQIKAQSIIGSFDISDSAQEQRNKIAAIEQGKLNITPKDIAVARIAYEAAGKIPPSDDDLVVQIQIALDGQK